MSVWRGAAKLRFGVAALTLVVWLGACGSSPSPGSLHTQTLPPANGDTAFDTARGVAVLVTQASAATEKSVQTWTWDGNVWSLRPSSDSPSNRNAEVLAYDPLRRTTVLYGGYSNRGQWLTDTWEWNGTRWTVRRPVHTPPESQAGFGSMAYDPLTHRILLFQWGRVVQSQWVNQTWTWDGNDWTLLQPAHTPLLVGGTLVFDGKRLVLIGDTSDGARSETWGWDGSDWSLLANAASRGFAGPSAALDSQNGVVVGFGGGPGDDTWIWDGVAWTRAHPKHSPDGTPRPLFYDTSLHRVVGFAGVGPITGIYEWSGTDWIALGVSSRPTIPAARNVMPADQAMTLIRQTVTGAEPILLPKLPPGVDQAWSRVEPTGFDLQVANDDRSILVGVAIVVPGNRTSARPTRTSRSGARRLFTSTSPTLPWVGAICGGSSALGTGPEIQG